MAVKITRHPEKIVLLGAPTSAAAMKRGPERAPAALRAAGLVERLRAAGYQVADHGDDPTHLSEPDPESPRARNLKQIVKSLESLRPRVEAAVKTGGLPIVLTGDCTSALATVAGVRRYFHSVSMIYVDRDADFNVPATTPSGCVDGMVVAHLTGRGAAELVRFWGEPPLVRDPDLAIFGADRFDPPEEELLQKVTIRSFPASEIKKKGAAATAKLALERVHASRNEFILHFDVDAMENFAATNYPGQGGLTQDEVREALEVFVQDKHLAAIDIAAFNPEKDTDGSAAKALVELIGDLLQMRLKALQSAAAPGAEAGDAGEADAAQVKSAVAGGESAKSATAKTAAARASAATEDAEGAQEDRADTEEAEAAPTETGGAATIEGGISGAQASSSTAEESPEAEETRNTTQRQTSDGGRPSERSTLESENSAHVQQVERGGQVGQAAARDDGSENEQQRTQKEESARGQQAEQQPEEHRDENELTTVDAGEEHAKKASEGSQS